MNFNLLSKTMSELYKIEESCVWEAHKDYINGENKKDCKTGMIISRAISMSSPMDS